MRALFVVLGAAFLLSGCSCGTRGLVAASTCGNPAKGQRYSLCLESTSGLGDGTVNHRELAGAVGAVHAAAKGPTYTLVGGTFHEAK